MRCCRIVQLRVRLSLTITILLEAGYIGKPPRFSIGLVRFVFYRSVAVYKDYWIRFHSLTPTTYLYSIFREKK